jgi:hypothetical protein
LILLVAPLALPPLVVLLLVVLLLVVLLLVVLLVAVFLLVVLLVVALPVVVLLEVAVVALPNLPRCLLLQAWHQARPSCFLKKPPLRFHHSVFLMGLVEVVLCVVVLAVPAALLVALLISNHHQDLVLATSCLREFVFGALVVSQFLTHDLEDHSYCWSPI